jgi:hypothetical protein
MWVMEHFLPASAVTAGGRWALLVDLTSAVSRSAHASLLFQNKCKDVDFERQRRRRPPMFRHALGFAVALMVAGGSSSPDAVIVPFGQDQLPWLRTESTHVEIHYLPTLARDVERVTRSAERAYDRISGRLSFSLPTKVPLVMFAPSEAVTREEAVSYATSDQVAPQQPHRSRIVLPLEGGDPHLDALMAHELTHLLVGEILVPHAPGDGGVPRWVQEGIASYMAGDWSDNDDRLMRGIVAAGHVPALSQLTGSGGFPDPRLNDALGHVAFDYIEGRWGPTSIRRFLSALIVPRVDRTYDAVFGLTPAEFDAAFRHYAERRFGAVVR